MNKRSDRVLAVAALSCVLLFCARAISVFHNGPHGQTSGFEEESLFAIWKWVNGQAVYADPYSPPFAQSYFNWLFYVTYGAFNSLFSGLASVPSISRTLTLLLGCASMVFSYLILSPLSQTRRIAGAAIIAFNPLLHFWTLTTRPDVGALAFALGGLWCIGKAERGRQALWLAMAFLAFYCSWAFKQTFLVAFAATFLHFALARRWKLALVFGGGAIIALGLTYLLGTPTYRYAVFASQAHSFFLLPNLKHNFAGALSKAPLFSLGLCLTLVLLYRRRLSLLILWAAMSTPIMLIASGKLGASDNYFFEPAAICSILFLLEGRFLGLAAAAQFIGPLLIAFGFAGTLFPRADARLDALGSSLAGLQGPIIVAEPGGNLPWFQSEAPHFVLATMYPMDKDRGKVFAFGGVEGMLRSGRIRVVVVPKGETEPPFYGIVPASLTKIKEDDYWAYFSTQQPTRR